MSFMKYPCFTDGYNKNDSIRMCLFFGLSAMYFLHAFYISQPTNIRPRAVFFNLNTTLGELRYVGRYYWSKTTDYL